MKYAVAGKSSSNCNGGDFCFFCTDPDDMNYKILSERVRYFKESEREVLLMCKIMEDFGNDRYNEGWKGGLAEGWAGGEAKKAKETAYKLAGRGDSPEEIADMVGYDVRIVEEWMKEYKASHV